jgi:hypothetical protein
MVTSRKKIEKAKDQLTTESTPSPRAMIIRDMLQKNAIIQIKKSRCMIKLGPSKNCAASF